MPDWTETKEMNCPICSDPSNKFYGKCPHDILEEELKIKPPRPKRSVLALVTSENEKEKK